MTMEEGSKRYITAENEHRRGDKPKNVSGLQKLETGNWFYSEKSKRKGYHSVISDSL